MVLMVLAVLIFAWTACEAQTVIEAEAMTVTGGGSNRAVTDGWALMGAATLNTAHTFISNAPRLDIIARADYAGGDWPLLEVKIGDVLYDTISIDSATWKTFPLSPQLSPGVHAVTFAFINDFYQAPADRNFYMDKVTITDPEPADSGSVTLAWDANSEPDLEGYNIYSGLISRKVDTTAKMQQWCTEHEPSNANCVAEWEAICKDKTDQACHALLHGYDRVDNVKNVTQYTLAGLAEGKTYYLAATAYDTDNNESAFSEELVHTISFKLPGQGEGFSYKDVVRWFIW